LYKNRILKKEKRSFRNGTHEKAYAQLWKVPSIGEAGWYKERKGPVTPSRGFFELALSLDRLTQGIGDIASDDLSDQEVLAKINSSPRARSQTRPPENIQQLKEDSAPLSDISAKTEHIQTNPQKLQQNHPLQRPITNTPKRIASEHQLQTILVSSIHQLSLKLRQSSERTFNLIRDTKGLNAMVEKVEPDLPPIPESQPSNQELAQILLNLRKTEKQLDALANVCL
jgi:hypothetical protein